MAKKKHIKGIDLEIAAIVTPSFHIIIFKVRIASKLKNIIYNILNDNRPTLLLQILQYYKIYASKF